MHTLIIVLIIIAVVVALLLLVLWMIAPRKNKPDLTPLLGYDYAHRGLFTADQSIPENSLPAFRRAVENGYGIELDIQLTADHQIVVFHDATLKRVCGIDRPLYEFTFQQLQEIPLANSDERIPLFSDVLALVNGRTPLIVEIKHESGPSAVAAAALNMLRAYQGPYCVESFHPMAVRYFRRHAPEVVRGQLAMGYKWQTGGNSKAAHFVLKHLLVNVLGRPHFIAYSVPTDHTLSMWLMKRLFHPYLAGWTIRSQDVLDESLRQGYRYPIFELFIPQKKSGENGTCV